MPARKFSRPAEGLTGNGILFVCTHNVCRSPMAEAVFRVKAADAGIADRFDIASAGTMPGQVGRRADPRAVAVAARHGYPIAPSRARVVTARDFDRFAMMFAMSEDNLRALDALKPASYEGRTALLLSQATHSPSREIPDPYFGSVAAFEHALQLIEIACDALVREIANLQD